MNKRIKKKKREEKIARQIVKDLCKNTMEELALKMEKEILYGKDNGKEPIGLANYCGCEVEE